MNRRGLLLILLLLCCSLSLPALAWGTRGHRLVGRIAEEHLGRTAPGVAEKARVLLRSSNQSPPPGEKECRPIGPARSFADVANSPDGFRQIELALVTRDWHFVNIDIANPTYDESRDCPSGDCVTRRISRMVEILEDDSRSPCDRESALIYLIHFVGDLHQPFHTGFGRLANNDPDLGGNRVVVVLDGEQRKLHGVWDTNLIERTNRTDNQWVRRLTTTVLAGRDPDTLTGGTVAGWTNESHELAAKFHLENEDPPVRLEDATIGEDTSDVEYIQEATAIVEERLLVGGLRLARLIREALE